MNMKINKENKLFVLILTLMLLLLSLATVRAANGKDSVSLAKEAPVCFYVGMEGGPAMGACTLSSWGDADKSRMVFQQTLHH